MSLPDLDPSRSASELFDDIVAYIGQAEKLLAAREMVSLAGLNQAVDALCERVMKLSPEQSKQYVTELEDLVGKLNQLQSNMMAARAALSADMSATGKRQRAARAYLSTPTTSGDE